MLGRYDRAMRARQPVGRLTLLQQAIAAIRRNNGALFYVPANFAGAWTDSAGTDPVDAVADVVGLLTDRSYGANNRGTELFSIASVAAGVTNNNGALTVSAVANGFAIVTTNHTLVVGKTYEVTFTVSGHMGGGASIRSGTTGSVGAVVGASNGVFREVFSPTISSGNFQFMSRYATTTLTISNVSVKEVFGAVATQATTANKPVVGVVATRLGPELTTNGDFNSSTGWLNTSTGTGSGAISGGVATTTGVDVSNRGRWILSPSLGGIVPGRRYEVSIRVVSGTANSQVVIAGASAGAIDIFPISGAQTIRRVITASGTTIGIYFNTYGAGTVTWDAFSVREVLEWSYAMSFDGSNDSLTTNITTGNEGWVCAGVTPANTTTTMSVANAGEGTSTIPGVWLFSASGLWQASAANGSARHQANVPMAGTQPQVVSMGWNASGIFVGVNTTDSAITARTGDCSSAANTLRIGMYQGSTNPFNGPMHAFAYTPVLPSAADRKIIRKLIGSLQGQTL